MGFDFQKTIKLTNRIILSVLLIVLIILITIGLKSNDDVKHSFNDIKQQLIVEGNSKFTNDYLPININKSTISYNNQTIGTITSEDETNYYLNDGKVLSKEIGLFNYLKHHSNEITYTSYDSNTFLAQTYIDEGQSQQEVHINYRLSLEVFNQYALQVQQTMSNVFNINSVNVDFQDCQLQILIKKDFLNRYTAKCELSLMINDNPHKMTLFYQLFQNQ